MNILETIVANKRVEVAGRKKNNPVDALERLELFSRPVLSFSDALSKKRFPGIIAEFKRKSPSKGDINATADVLEVTRGYFNGGAAALSVLTDKDFFGGTSDDLRKARVNPIPILRKDFVVDEYQIVEAKAIGADMVLLIAACLSVEEVKRLAAFAKSLGLEVLLEIHDETELGHISYDTGIIGVNNRNLKTFSVDIRRSLELNYLIPNEKIKISESGLNTVADIKTLYEAGFKGFLIGERFMKESSPANAFALFVNSLKSLSTSVEGKENNV